MSSSSSVGLLDANIVIHSLVEHNESEECRRLLNAVSHGRVRAIIEPLVLHELSYVLTRPGLSMRATDAADYLQTLLTLKGAEGDLQRMSEALALWRDHPKIGFVDCYLAAKSKHLHVPVYTKNLKHLQRLGAESPDPLPGD